MKASHPRHAAPSKTKRRLVALGAAGVSVATVVSNSAAASALSLPFSLPELPQLPQLPQSLGDLSVGSSAASSSDVIKQLPENYRAQIDDLVNQSRERVWDSRVWLHQQAAALPPQLQDPARQAVDQVVEGLFPGLIAQKLAEEDAARQAAEAAAAPAPTPAPAAAPAQVAENPCPAQARACIDLAGGKTWLQSDGQITYGPVPMSAGAPSPETETPKGAHFVNRKVEDEISHEFGGAPMPYSVYFTNNGIAFHQGTVGLLSNGCVHLNREDAMAYFDQLEIGDMVYVF